MFLEYDNIENNANGLSVLAIMASPRKSGFTAKLLGSLLREFPKGTDIEIVNLYDLNPVPCNACGYCKAGNGCSKKELEEFFKKFEKHCVLEKVSLFAVILLHTDRNFTNFLYA